MRTIADFVPFVRFKSRHDTEANIQHAVRESVIAFMRESRAAVNEVFLDVAAVCGLNDALLNTPDCQRLVGIESVWLAPKKCDTQRWTPAWEQVRNTDGVKMGDQFFNGIAYWVDDVGGPQTTLWLSTLESRKHTLCVRYSWAIGRDNCEVPEWVYQDYADLITDGALAYLHDNPDDDNAASAFAGRSGTKFILAARRVRERKRSNYAARSTTINTGWGFAG